MLFNEPKLLKSFAAVASLEVLGVSVLFNEPKLLKSQRERGSSALYSVSVLFNEPKLLKYVLRRLLVHPSKSFSALQRAEIAEI